MTQLVSSLVEVAAPAIDDGVMASISGTQTPLVGRAGELALLTDVLGLREAEPTGGSVLLFGDAGVGKTRLLRALKEEAEAAGWRVLVGHCLDFGDSALPYLPFAEAIGGLGAQSPALLESLVRDHDGLARLAGPSRGAHRQSASEVDRAELFEAVHAALDELSQLAPLLLVVEDVHWADQSTRDMLTFLFSRPLSGPVSIVASYRGDDLHRRHPLRALAAQWARLPGVTRQHLQPLSDGDVRTLVSLLQPSALSEEDVRTIVARAEGNAFFTEELLAAAASGAGSLPADLADLLLVRLDRLDAATRDVVRAAAVAGRRVSHDLLAAVVGLDQARLDEALRTAVESYVLVSAAGDGYAFRHALLAEAVYGDLLPGERVRLHRAYVDALRESAADGFAAELARHARAAHDTPTAITASIDAGDEAMAMAGPDEAARHYEVALELLAEHEDSSVDVADLTVRAAQAATVAGNPYRASRLVQDRLQSLPANAAAAQRAQLLLVLAKTALVTDAGMDLVEVTGEALRLTEAEPRTRLRAQVLSVRAHVFMDQFRAEDARRWAAEAVALGRELNLPDVVADAQTTLARLHEQAGDLESSRQALERNLAEARAAGEIDAELRGTFNLGIVHYEAGRLATARTVFESATQRAVETGRPWAPYPASARAMAAIAAYVTGDWDGVLATVDVEGQSPPPGAEAMLQAAALPVAAGRGQAAALEQLDRLRPWWERDGLVAIICAGAAIDLHGDRGDLSAAQAVHDDLIACITELWQLEGFQARIRMAALLLGQLATAASRSSSQDHTDLAAAGDRLVQSAALAIDSERRGGREQGPEGQAWIARVTAEHNRLRWLTGVDLVGQDDLVRSWEAATAAFEDMGHVFERARSQARLAAVLRAVGRADEAADVSADALDTAQRLGARPLLEELQSGGARTPRTSRRDQPLTGRELEVLTLVAAGRSNREIGRQLYISDKTVSVHVSNILAKLGAAGRTEAVALARRQGLLP